MKRHKPKPINLQKPVKVQDDSYGGLDDNKVYRTKTSGMPEYQLLKHKADRVDLRKRLMLMGYSEDALDGMTTREMAKILENE